MVSTKWFKGKENLEICYEIRKNVFYNELNLDCEFVSDIFDEFSFNVVLYEDEKAVGTGRLIFNDGKYSIDKICVLSEYRGKSFGELIIRMLIRKAVTIGADKTYSILNKKYKLLFDKVGFQEISLDDNDNFIMVKEGDVGGHCS